MEAFYSQAEITELDSTLRSMLRSTPPRTVEALDELVWPMDHARRLCSGLRDRADLSLTALERTLEACHAFSAAARRSTAVQEDARRCALGMWAAAWPGLLPDETPVLAALPLPLEEISSHLAILLESSVLGKNAEGCPLVLTRRWILETFDRVTGSPAEDLSGLAEVLGRPDVQETALVLWERGQGATFDSMAVATSAATLLVDG